MLIVVVLVVIWGAAVALTVTPITAAWSRGESGWGWIVAALLFGPLAGISWLLTLHGRRAAVRRSGPPA
jgi:hypothetical protein